MDKGRLDLQDGDIIIGADNGVGIDSDGHVMINVGGLSIDTETGETHITAPFGPDDD